VENIYGIYFLQLTLTFGQVLLASDRQDYDLIGQAMEFAFNRPLTADDSYER
jgi:hypothetical protein